MKVIPWLINTDDDDNDDDNDPSVYDVLLLLQWVYINKPQERGHQQWHVNSVTASTKTRLQSQNNLSEGGFIFFRIKFIPVHSK